MPEERDAYFRTSSGNPLENEYGADDLADWNADEKLGHAGEAPFTRGNHPSGYKGRLWTMRQYAGYATAAESNRRYRHLLEQGQSGLSVAFDLPTQIGYDSDHELAKGEVGRVGVAIDSLDDMETLFTSIPLDRVSTSMTINATAATLLALYIAVGRRQGPTTNLGDSGGRSCRPRGRSLLWRPPLPGSNPPSRHNLPRCKGGRGVSG